MRLALAEAEHATLTGDVPVGAVVLAADGAVLARAHNEREATGDPTAHAEVLAIRRAAAALAAHRDDAADAEDAAGSTDGTGGTGLRTGTPHGGDRGAAWQLAGCTLVVTLEPCTMCAGAAVLSRLDRVVYGASDPKAGAAGSLWDLVRDRRLNHRPEVVSGVLPAPAATLLSHFFRPPAP
jgi:tRNA(adenine34) deaminase